MTATDPILDGLDDLPPTDRAAVEAFAAQAARMREARRRIDAEGLIVEDSKGFPIPHPAIDIERAASREMRGWETARPDLFAGSKPAPAKTSMSGGGGTGNDGGTIDDELAAARAARQAGS